ARSDRSNARTRSVSPASSDDGRYRPEQDRHVEQKAPVLHVHEVETDALLRRQHRPPTHLPQPTETGAHDHPPAEAELFGLPKAQRPWADEAHVTTDDVPKLWQLVE